MLVNNEQEKHRSIGYNANTNIPKVTDCADIPQNLRPRRHVDASISTVEWRRFPYASLPSNSPSCHSNDTDSQYAAYVLHQCAFPKPVLLDQFRKRIIRALPLVVSRGSIGRARASPPATTLRERITEPPS